jgi:tRNA G46 methylase TrmB
MDLEQKRKFFIIEERELNFQQIYGNSAPIHLEIGCGKGEFLAMKSRVKWDKKFFGNRGKTKKNKKHAKKARATAPQ